MHYPETIRPALQVIGAHPKAGIVSGMHMLVFEKHIIFCGDTTVNIDPSAEQLAQIAYAASRIARTLGITPRIAMLSFSNFGSVVTRTPEIARRYSCSAKRPHAHRRRRDQATRRSTRRSSIVSLSPSKNRQRLICPTCRGGNIA